MKRHALALVAALAALTSTTSPGCTSGIGAAAPRAMNHPVDVAFACFDTSIAGLPVVRPLSDCELRVDVSSNTRQPPANSAMHMHALVTQLTRGEVGAVDLIARGVLDSDVSVPGYTFVPVGELPTRIVVRPSDNNGLGHDQAACTYVASRGAVDGRHPGISIIDTRRFRSGAGLDHNPFPVFAPYILPAAPSDMVLAPDEQSLWVTLDALGVLVRVPVVSSCELGPIDLVVPLYEEVPAGVDVRVTPPGDARLEGSSVDLTRRCPAITPRIGVACQAPTPTLGVPCDAAHACAVGLSCLPTADGAGYCTSTCDPADPSCSCETLACNSGTACDDRFGAPACLRACGDDADCSSGQCWGGVCQPACSTDAQCGGDATCTAGRCEALACCTDTTCMPPVACPHYRCADGLCAEPRAVLAGCESGLECMGTPDGVGYCTLTCDPADTSCSCGSLSCTGGTACNDRFGAPACFIGCSADGDCESGQQCWAGLCQPACTEDAHCGPHATCSSGRCAPRTCTTDPTDTTCAPDACVDGLCLTPVATLSGARVEPPVAPEHVGPRATSFDAAVQSEPVAIAFDEANGLILVADRGLPLIHRVRIADGTLDTPIATGVPVRDVVVTPRVPDSYALVPDPDAGACPGSTLHPAGAVVPAPATAITFSRFVYAIDDTDGSVMAIEYSDPTRAGFGGVIPVDVRGARQPDRIAMPVVARTLEIITPQFDTTAADPRFGPVGPDRCTPPLLGNPSGYGLCIPTDRAPTQPPSPSVLRGVFLVVAAADGSVRIVDVYDLDAPCRGRTIGGVDGTTGTVSADCTSPTITGDEVLYVRRHRPRQQLFLTQFVEIDAGPTVYFPGGGSVVLQNDGLPTGVTSDVGSTTPHLRALGDDAAASSCPSGLGVVWPPPSDYPGATPVVCSIVDPFAAIVETWSATFEGGIPGTYTSSANAQTDGSGRFTGILDTRIDYCAQGVIGRQDAVTGSGAPEALYEGDMIALLGALPDGALDQEICRRVVGIEQVGQQQQPILARLDRAFTSPDGQQEPYLGRLIIDPATPLENRSDGTTIADAVHCYGDRLLTIEVRSYGAFTVNGTRSGFMHRVARDPADGHCQYDFSRDALRQGHAFNDVLFHNARIAFRPTNVPTRLLTNELAEIRMVLNGNISQAGIDLSSSATGIRQPVLPAGLRYSPQMWALYAIESERRGLVEMTLRPLAVTQTAYQ